MLATFLYFTIKALNIYSWVIIISAVLSYFPGAPRAISRPLAIVTEPGLRLTQKILSSFIDRRKAHAFSTLALLLLIMAAQYLLGYLYSSFLF